MTITITLPQARIALGWAVVKGERIPVQIDMEWMLALAALVERTGGVMGDTNFFEYLNQLFETPPLDLGARDALRAVDELRNEQPRMLDPRVREQAAAIDELRNELNSARGDMQALRQLADELSARIDAAQQNEQLRNRIETIEGRLA